MAIQNYADNGAFAPRKIVDALRTTSDELARSLGLGKDAIQRKDRIASDRTQRRLRQMVEVLNKVEPRFGSALLAYAWYRSEPLPGFSGQTAMQLVQSDRRPGDRNSVNDTQATQLINPEDAQVVDAAADAAGGHGGDVGHDATGVDALADRHVASIHAAIFFISAAPMPRLVMEGVPSRMPEGSLGLRVSPGTVL